MARIAVFYHYLFPDPVVSSVLLSQLCSGLADHGWEVDAYCCNRPSGEEAIIYSKKTAWHNVHISRVWRPNWRQSSSKGRILNALWMIAHWGCLAFRWKNSPDIILMGTDPIMSVLIAPVWRLLHPRVKIVHWCFDLYPEAAYADGLLSPDGPLSRVLEWAVKHSYRRCDLIVDLGPCMRALLLKYTDDVPRATLVPWALCEPSTALATPQAARVAIFGEAKLTMMYSGTMGRAHSYSDLLALMRYLRHAPVHLALSLQGNREKDLRASIQPEDSNISFVPFAPATALEERLAAPDIHVVSLRPEWTGMVVPSKFFGALAVGRPVLFCGSPESAIARWIEEHHVGWVLTPGNVAEIAERLKEFVEDPSSLNALREHCHRIYQQYFSRDAIITHWNSDLKNLLQATIPS